MIGEPSPWGTSVPWGFFYLTKLSRGAATMPEFTKAATENFISAVNRARAESTLVRENVDCYNADKYRVCYLSSDERSGFAITQEGELTGLFDVSGARGRGERALQLAVAIGATSLNAFEGKLNSLYSKYGFVETRREANWTPGEPDVVFMERRHPTKSILHLFPGGGLSTIPATESGLYSVYRGPDVLHGSDIRGWTGVANVDGVIGGPPCQVHSKVSALNGTNALNLIPEFLRVVAEVKPGWAVMENATNAPGPDWPSVVLRDCDVGGLTKRTRRIWFYGVPSPSQIPFSEEAYRAAAPTVMATSHKNRGPAGRKKGFPTYNMEEAARLQGYGPWLTVFNENIPTGLSQASINILAVHQLGNALTRAMSTYIFNHINRSLYHA